MAESAYEAAVRRYKYHHNATSVENASDGKGGTIYRAYFQHGGYYPITAEALYGAAPTPDEEGIDVKALAKFIAELINGGHWDNPAYYTPEQQALWITHAAKIAAEAKRVQT